MVTDWFGTLGTERVAVGLDDLQTIVAQDVAVAHPIVTYKGLPAEGQGIARHAQPADMGAQTGKRCVEDRPRAHLGTGRFQDIEGHPPALAKLPQTQSTSSGHPASPTRRPRRPWQITSSIMAATWVPARSACRLQILTASNSPRQKQVPDNRLRHG